MGLMGEGRTFAYGEKTSKQNFEERWRKKNERRKTKDYVYNRTLLCAEKFAGVTT